LGVAFCLGSWNSLKARIFSDEVSVDSEDGEVGGEEGDDDVIMEEGEEEDNETNKGERGFGDRVPETIGPKAPSTSERRDKFRFCGRSKTENSRRRRATTTPIPRSRSFSIVDALDSIREFTPFADFVTRRHQRNDLIDGELGNQIYANAINRLFVWLFFACCVVYVFNHPAILQLLPLPTLFIIVKRGVIWLWRRYHPLSSYVDEATRDLIIPKPIFSLWSVVCKGDQKILVLIESTISKVTTVVLLFLLIICATLFGLIMLAQVQRESVQLMWTSANLVNETVSSYPEIAKWLPQADSMHSTVTSLIEKGYEHGREWLAKKVSSLIAGEGENDKNKVRVEKELLLVIDNLYRSWHANQSDASSGISELCKLGLTSCPAAFDAGKFAPDKNSLEPVANSKEADSEGGGRVPVTQTEIESRGAQVWKFIENMIKMTELKDILDLNRIMEIARDNIGSVVAIIESLLLIIRTNVNSVFNFVTAMISLLFGGGTVLLNFVVSTIVFLTALFYLLSISEKDYKPISWLTAFSGSIVGGSGDFEAAISSVLLATLKMAVFYGLYTWLTHTIFGVNIVCIPSFLAAILAAVPFIGTYWAAVPAMIELWVLKNDLLRAILLLIAHLMPTYFIDMLIYGDIKDGGHPYLTGLAIVGGIYFLGLQGAIIGPILLCCLIVVFNVYQRMLANESVSARTAAVDADSSQNSSQLQRAFVLDRNVPPNIPALYLHRSTPTDASTSSPANIGGVTSAASLLSPATPNSVFRPGGRSALRKAAVVGSRRLHRSNSLPNVDDA